MISVWSLGNIIPFVQSVDVSPSSTGSFEGNDLVGGDDSFTDPNEDIVSNNVQDKEENEEEEEKGDWNVTTTATTTTEATTTTTTEATTATTQLDPNRSYGFWDPDVELIRQQYWQRTLAEIRALTQHSTFLPTTIRKSTTNRSSSSSTTTTNTPTTTASSKRRSNAWMYPNNDKDLSGTANSTFFKRWKALTTITPPTIINANININTTTDTDTSSNETTTTNTCTPFDDETEPISISTSSITNEVTETEEEEEEEDQDSDFDPNYMTSLIANRLSSTIPRFDGFPSWERMLNDWSDDVQEYLQQVNEEQSLGYSIGNYGRAPPATTTLTATSTIPTEPPTPTSTSNNGTTNAGIGSTPTKPLTPPIVVKAVSTLPLPIPTPAKPGDTILDYTDISNKSKSILIVTTASLPWKTGTAVNPLLRAAYLSMGRKEVGGNVTLMIPWLERKVDQMSIYGPNNIFTTPDEQEQYIRQWLNESANMLEASQDLHIEWYTAWQNKVENSIYSMGDLTANLSSAQYDICILEEPEHLNWYRAPGESWTKKFQHVVGILHTNYFSYALDQPAALIRAPAMRLLCSWMCRAHCHRVIKLSATLDKVAPEKELVENVHGVRGTFLDIGAKVRTMLLRQQQQLLLPFIPSMTSTTDIPLSESVFRADSEPTIYFIGKMLWSKGLGSLMELLKYAEESAALRVTVDMYGGGPDLEAASKKAEKLMLDMTFRGPLDHAELAYTHKIFVNPSTSEVLCTTSAEALAMGKFVIIPSHPSNDFFAQFPNCLTYATKEEFVGELYYAMTHAPEPLSDEHAYALSWEAATQRLEAAGCITVEENEQMQQALSSDAAGIEIALPPIVDNEESRKEISKVFRFSRLRYRQFRTRLSQEIQESKGTIDSFLDYILVGIDIFNIQTKSNICPNFAVLPKSVRDRLVTELDKRLEIDIDQFLDSPKLRLKLSPAELDKSLLELYDTVSESPGGDILRLIGGGGAIALQNLYMRRRSERERWRKMKEGAAFAPLDIFPTYVDDDGSMDNEINDGTPTQLIRQSLRRNLPRITPRVKSKTKATEVKSDTTPTMCVGISASSRTRLSSHTIHEWNGLRPVPKALTRSSKFSILI